MIPFRPNGVIRISSVRWPLIIDPQLKVSLGSRHGGRALESSRLGSRTDRVMSSTQGTSILIENMEKGDKALLPILQRVNPKKAGRSLIALTRRDYSPGFCLFTPSFQIRAR